MKMLFYGTPDFMELVGTFKDEEEIFYGIKEFLERKKIKPYYYRMWPVNYDDGEYTKVDYGSHSKFFFIRELDKSILAREICKRHGIKWDTSATCPSVGVESWGCLYEDLD